MRPGITLLAVLKVHINSGKMDTPLTVSKSGRQHGREGHIPLDLNIQTCLVVMQYVH